MNQEEIILSKIEELFRTRPWAGVISLDEAIADAQTYRAGLDTEEKAAFDEQILLGIHPSRAIEAVELMSGRIESRMASRKERAAIANVS